MVELAILHDRVCGCILGGAIGDGLGASYEGSATPIVVDNSTPWNLTDDTQLTLATCEAIIESRQVDAAAIAGKMAAVFRRGEIVGIGASTYKSLSEIAMGVHWAIAGRKGDRAAGNGAAMRIAPLAFFIDPEKMTDRQILRDVSRITHHHEEAYAGSLAVVSAIRAAWLSHWNASDELMKLVTDTLPDCLVKERLIEISALPSTTSLTEIAKSFGSSGFVAESVPLAIFAAQQIQRFEFESLITEIIACGGDTDTNASIAGQILGASLGRTGLPEKLLSQLPERGKIEVLADKLADLVIGESNFVETLLPM